MIIPTQPNFNVVNNPDYREAYANSVQVRVNVWDFFLVFGTMQPPARYTDLWQPILNLEPLELRRSFPCWLLC